MDFFSTNAASQSSLSQLDSSEFAQAIASRFTSGAMLTTRLAPPPPRHPQPRSPALPLPPSSFPPVAPSALDPWLSDPAALLVDIRPHAAWTAARLPHALSLSVPSTLLKRPLFSLQRLAAMLPSPAARVRFSAWNSASRILVYDADSHAAPDASNISGLLRKFRADGFTGELAWLQGGFQALWRDRREVVDQNPPTPDTVDDDDDDVLRTRHLFNPAATPSANPFFDAIRQNVELAHANTERIPLVIPRRVRRRIHELPFTWLRTIASRDDPDEALAAQFYKIELAEQKRLTGIMQHHARESNQPATPFPYSITAGIEKGTKNRYRHIWPFEHARVRLRQSEDDYVNASYIQPLATSKRYIATQGPLAATFVDFWTLTWEQNVQVIVMLTREIEGSMEKCGAYWKESSYGPLSLRLVSTETTHADEQPSPTVHFSTPHTVKRVFELSHTAYPATPPRKIIHLQYLEWPDMNVPDDPRGVLGLVRQVDEAVQQTRRWNQPQSTSGVDQRALGDNSPVLLHCSAGVGRTGGFIAVDAVLDALRRELRLLSPDEWVHSTPTASESDSSMPDRPRTMSAPLPASPPSKVAKVFALSSPGSSSRRHRPLSLDAEQPPPPAPAPLTECKDPRPLHKEMPPSLLSQYNDPIWEVVQDMREQRMSLCQSLRQYVFVHAAIIEGALMIMDDEARSTKLKRKERCG